MQNVFKGLISRLDTAEERISELKNIWTVVLLFSCVWLCNPMNCSMPGSSVLSLLEFTRVHVYWIGDAIQPSHPLLPPSPSAFHLSHRQGLFQWASSLHQVAKVLELQLQHQSFQWIFRVDFLQDWLVWFSYSPRDFQESFPTQQFESISSLVLSLVYGPTLTCIHDYWKNHSFNYMGLCWQNDVFFLIHCLGLS